jgi:hypothetical protein
MAQKYQIVKAKPTPKQVDQKFPGYDVVKPLKPPTPASKIIKGD